MLTIVLIVIALACAAGLGWWYVRLRNRRERARRMLANRLANRSKWDAGLTAGRSPDEEPGKMDREVRDRLKRL